MKKMRFIPIALTLVAFACSFGFSACEKEEEVPSGSVEYVMNSYESYDDLVRTSSMRTMLGSIELVKDKQYVTDGNSSAKFYFTKDTSNGDNQVYGGEVRNVSKITYSSYDYLDHFKFIDRVDYFSLDVYNATDSDYELYFGAKSEVTSTYIYTNGATLAANQWNHIRFDVNGYCYDSGTATIQYDLFWLGMERLPDEGATFYVDNMRIALYEETAAAPALPEGEPANSLLSFDSIDDMRYVTAKSICQASRMPLVRLGYEPFASCFEGGAMRMDMYPANWNNQSYWMSSNGYCAQILSSVAQQARGAKEVSVLCYNPNPTDEQVSLRVKCGYGYVLSTATVPAGQTAKITFAEETALVGLESLEIRVACWRIGQTGTTLYFSNLRFEK